MTQKDALEKALKELGGRARLQDIYPVAERYIIHKENSKIKDSLRGAIHDKRRFRPSPGKPDGWYELLSFQEEIASRDKRISKLETLLAERDKEIAELRKQPTVDSFVKKLVIATMDLFGVNKKHADYVRLVLLKLGRNKEHEILLEWINTRETKTRRKTPGNIIQKISNSQVFNGSITESEFNSARTVNEE